MKEKPETFILQSAQQSSSKWNHIFINKYSKKNGGTQKRITIITTLEFWHNIKTALY